MELILFVSFVRELSDETWTHLLASFTACKYLLNVLIAIIPTFSYAQRNVQNWHGRLCQACTVLPG
jgi:hypothetical protein